MIMMMMMTTARTYTNIQKRKTQGLLHLPYNCHVRPPPENVDAWISDYHIDRCTDLVPDRIGIWHWIKGSQYKFARHKSGTETSEHVK